ncbi:TPA: recombinase family protein [Vibrio harveyi]
MANEKYYTIVTKRGKEKIQDYYRKNKTLPLTHMGFGGIDGDDANYLRPSVEMTVVPGEWARIGIERKSDEGFIGGGATIENKVDEYKGKWICNVGIYDEDGELILISAYRPLLVDPEESIVSSYPINIQSVLANAEHVVVQTDTSITHPTHDEMNQALEELDNKLSKYATTDAAGLIELATPQEVSTGEDAKRAVTPATLKPELDEIKELISESEGSLSQPATTERLGLTELATQQEVDQRTGGEQVVTAQTLDKPGLISFLQRYADEEVKKLKELIFGGNPSAALDTLFELANAYEGAADSIQNILNTLSIKLSTSTFETFQTTYHQWKAQIQEQVKRKWEAVDASTSRNRFGHSKMQGKESLIGFARVSSQAQDLTDQLYKLEDAGCSHIFSGKHSGKADANKEALEKLEAYVREGDIVLVTKLDRLGRSTAQVVSLIERLHNKGVYVRTLEQGIDTSKDDAMSRAFYQMLAVFAEMERSMIQNRLDEGKVSAVRSGKHTEQSVKGGRSKSYSIEQEQDVVARITSGQSIHSIANDTGLTRQTIYRIKAKHDSTQS